MASVVRVRRFFFGYGFGDDGKSLARIPCGFPHWEQLAGRFRVEKAFSPGVKGNCRVLLVSN